VSVPVVGSEVGFFEGFFVGVVGLSVGELVVVGFLVGLPVDTGLHIILP
jgi:hypothetical protein